MSRMPTIFACRRFGIHASSLQRRPSLRDLRSSLQTGRVADNHATIRGSGNPAPAGSADNFVFASAPGKRAGSGRAVVNLIQGDHFDFSSLKGALDHITLPPEVNHVIETLQALVADTIAHDPGIVRIDPRYPGRTTNLYTHLDLHL